MTEVLKSARSTRNKYELSPVSPRNDIRKMCDELHDEAIRMAKTAQWRASWCKMIHNVSRIIILLMSAVVAILGFITSNTIRTTNNSTIIITPNINDLAITYVIGILGILSTLITGLDMYFGVGKRALSYKQNSINLKKIARTIVLLKNNRKLTTEELNAKLDALYDGLDGIEMSIFTGDQDTLAQVGSFPDDNIEETNKKEKTILNIISEKDEL